MAALPAHPTAEVAAGVGDAGQGRHHFGQHRLRHGAVAEIGRDRLCERVLVLADRCLQQAQACNPLLPRGRRVAAVGQPLHLQRARRRFGGRHLDWHRGGVHVGSPCTRISEADGCALM